MKKRKGYIFTNKRHSYRAAMSVALGAISLVSLCIVIFLAYRGGGEAAVKFGFTGLFALLFSLAGLFLGVLTFSDKTYYRLFPVLGILLNFAALGFISLILYAGANL